MICKFITKQYIKGLKTVILLSVVLISFTLQAQSYPEFVKVTGGTFMMGNGVR